MGRWHGGWVLGLVVLLSEGPVSAAERKPATVADAVKMIDLSKFPLLPGAKEPGMRTVAQLSYLAPSTCQAAFEFQKKSLTALQWKELPGSALTDQYASGAFTREGFVLSVTTVPAGDPTQPMLINVMLTLHGNVDLQKLPLPPGLKSVYVGPQIAMYATEAPVPETVAACRKLLMAAGWQPYGQAGDTSFFKQNGIRLGVSISSAPGQGGKTTISLNSEQLSADIPAPAETVQLQYSDSTKQLLFDTKESQADVIAFYRKSLGASKWEATTENANRIGFKDVLIFRDPLKNLLTLETHQIPDENVLRVTVKYETAAEVAAMEQRMKEQVAAAKKKKEAEKNAPVPKLTLSMPAQAKVKKESKSVWELTVASGQAKAAVAPLRKALIDAGWKEEATVDNGMIGEITFSKDEQQLNLSYVDPGFIPGEITLRATRVELQKQEPGR